MTMQDVKGNTEANELLDLLASLSIAEERPGDILRNTIIGFYARQYEKEILDLQGRIKTLQAKQDRLQEACSHRLTWIDMSKDNKPKYCRVCGALLSGGIGNGD